MGEVIVIEEDPAQCFGEGVKEVRATSVSEGEADSEVVAPVPVNPKKVPEVKAQREDFESRGEVSLRQPARRRVLPDR